MFRKDIRIAWNLLHMLNDDWQKIYGLAIDMSIKYNEPVSENYLSKIISHMAHYDFLETRKNRGVRRSTKKIIFMDELFVAFNIKLLYSTNTPYGRAMLPIWDQIKRIEFKNDRILHRMDK